MANVSREDVIRRMCILLTKVGNIQFKDQYGHDCFCADEHKHSGSFIFDEEVIRFVESTIELKLLECHKTTQVPGVDDEHEFQPSADMKKFIAKSVKDARQMIQSKEPIRQCPSGIPTISQIHGKNGVEFQWSRIHNNEDGFDSDLVALDRVYWKDGEVVYADRLFRIPSPKWLQRFFFGKEINS